MITRAIAMLIVVGDHEILNTDRDWAQFIAFVENNGALVKNGKQMHPRIKAS